MDAEGVPRTVKADVPDVILTLVGLLMAISIPALSAAVLAPMTTVICVVETILHDAVAPWEGVLPIFAAHV